MPEEVVTDGGPEFKGMYNDLCKLLKVDHILINAYSPAENAEVERKNKIISDFLSKYCNDHQEDWDEYVHLAAFHYNCSRHAITKQIPFCLERGTEPRLEIDEIFNTVIGHDDDINITLWTKEMIPKITKSLREASRQIRKVQLKNLKNKKSLT